MLGVGCGWKWTTLACCISELHWGCLCWFNVFEFTHIWWHPEVGRVQINSDRGDCLSRSTNFYYYYQTYLKWKNLRINTCNSYLCFMKIVWKFNRILKTNIFIIVAYDLLANKIEANIFRGRFFFVFIVPAAYLPWCTRTAVNFWCLDFIDTWKFYSYSPSSLSLKELYGPWQSIDRSRELLHCHLPIHGGIYYPQTSRYTPNSSIWLQTWEEELGFFPPLWKNSGDWCPNSESGRFFWL